MAIHYDEVVDFDLAGQAWAQGGHGWGENVEHGGAGTVYLKDKAQALGVLVIHNGTTGSNAAATS